MINDGDDNIPSNALKIISLRFVNYF